VLTAKKSERSAAMGVIDQSDRSSIEVTILAIENGNGNPNCCLNFCKPMPRFPLTPKL